MSERQSRNRNRLRCIAILACAFLAATSPMQAQGLCPTLAQHGQDCFVTTHHQITVDGSQLQYTARAGLLPIRDNETGEVHAQMFFVAYILDHGPNEAARPITFVWNGGPGANSVFVHLVAFGPKRIVLGGSSAPTLAVNPQTWLNQTDLVFVDPIGTGYSRPTRAGYGKEFYNTLGDFASVTEFIRVYQTRFDRWTSPLFVAGESYGGWRAAGVTQLLERAGHKVAGVIEISGGVGFGAVQSDEVKAALFVPSRTAAAFYHKKLSRDLQLDLQGTLQKSEAWAKKVYLPALMRRDSLSDQERRSIVAQLSRFTGIDTSLIDKRTLVVSRHQFVTGLLQDQHRELGRFDTRMTAPDSSDAERAPLVNQYMRDELQFKTELVYQGMGDAGYTPETTSKAFAGFHWDYNTQDSAAAAIAARENAVAAAAHLPPTELDGPPGVQPWLQRAMLIDPSIRIFVAAGWYDSLNSCIGNTDLVSRLEPRFKHNITLGCYGGGHMMYTDPGARIELRRDIGKFFQATLAGAIPARQ